MFDQAWDWFLAERSNLIAVVEHAHSAGFRLCRRGEWHTWIHALQLALDAAKQAADLTGEEFAHRFLADAYIRVEELNASRTHIEHCFELHQKLHDSLAHIHRQVGEHEAAHDAFEMSLQLYRDVGDRYWEATALRYLGDLAATTGDPAQARRRRTAALEILIDLDHPDAAALRAELDGS